MNKMIQAMAFFARNEETGKIHRTRAGRGHGMTENTVISSNQSRVIVNLNNVPVTEDMLKSGDQSIRLTNLHYALVYYSPGSKRYVKGMPFVIRSDLVHFCVRVNSYNHFLLVAEKIPEFKWLAENTNICPELFDIARFHLGIGIPIAFDAVAYAKKIGALENKQSPFLGFQHNHVRGLENLRVENKREKGYYKKELEEIYSNGDDYEQEKS